MHKNTKGFTLAEVLITLAIIGVVAALTIPTLIQNYQERAWGTASEVFQRKLGEALRVMNVQGTLAGYTTTEAFVDELSKHIKITRICDNDDITTCFADKVTWDGEEVEMSKIKTSKNFGKDDWNTNTVAVQFANGVNGVIAYNPTETCKQDPYSNQITGTSCLAILYDVDGVKNPNTQSKDLKQINVSSLGESNCVLQLDGFCFTAPFLANVPLTYDECIAHKDEWQIEYCYNTDENYWGGVVKKCGGAQNMPTFEHLAKLADYIYNTNGVGAEESISLEIDMYKVYEFGGGSFDFLPIPTYMAFSIYGNEYGTAPFSGENGYGGRYFSETGSFASFDVPTRSGGVGVCIAK